MFVWIARAAAIWLATKLITSFFDSRESKKRTRRGGRSEPPKA